MQVRHFGCHTANVSLGSVYCPTCIQQRVCASNSAGHRYPIHQWCQCWQICWYNIVIGATHTYKQANHRHAIANKANRQMFYIICITCRLLAGFTVQAVKPLPQNRLTTEASEQHLPSDIYCKDGFESSVLLNTGKSDVIIVRANQP